MKKIFKKQTHLFRNFAFSNKFDPTLDYTHIPIYPDNFVLTNSSINEPILGNLWDELYFKCRDYENEEIIRLIRRTIIPTIYDDKRGKCTELMVRRLTFRGEFVGERN